MIIVLCSKSRYKSYIENYINKANNAQQNDESMQSPINCDGFYYTMQSYFDNKQIAVSVCKEILKLYKSLNTNNKKLTKCNEYKKDCGFFNYWVNLRISKSIINGSQCVNYIYNGIDSQFMQSNFFYSNSDNIYDIDKNELDKMNILYRLYENYSELKTIINATRQQDKRSLLPFSTECCTDYIQAKYICNDDDNNESTFCQKLKSFESEYEKLYQEFDRKRSEFSDNLIKLSECPNNKIITTAVTGTVVGLIPLFGVLYKVSNLNNKQ
ncbi:hypothetical protein PVBG_05682 [Plasmodium vivax Brazil I]|uniref:Uncharacterized protein n=1 Tax=Plasmodium vivax (strain Brazil I) TaxID=1033975 RepID=A0A0J9T130_PLAV1|nr:hypothetical protein PVBG_05682 [Plasmodium vivax Brazil I]